MTRLHLLLSLIPVLLSGISVEQSENLERNNAPNTVPPTSPAPPTNLPTNNLHLSDSYTNTTLLEESANLHSGHSLSEEAILNEPTFGEHAQLDRPGTVQTVEPRFSCARGAICSIKIAEIVNSLLFSNVTVSSGSAGLIFDVSEDKEKIVGLPITHGLASFSLKYNSKDQTPTVVDFKVFISEKQHPTHFFFLTLTKPELTCRENPHLCLELLEDIARSLGGPSSTLTLTRFSKDKKGITTVSFYNNTLSLKECEKGKIEEMRTKMAVDNGTDVKEGFLKKMGNEYAFVSFFFKPMTSCEGYSSIPLLQDTNSQSFKPSVFGTVISAFLLFILVGIALKGACQYCQKEQRQNETADHIEMGLLENQIEEDVIDNVEEENMQDDENSDVLVNGSNVV